MNTNVVKIQKDKVGPLLRAELRARLTNPLSLQDSINLLNSCNVDTTREMSILQQIEVTKDTECWTGLMRSDVIYADTKAGQVVTVVASDTFGSLLILVRDGFGVWVPAKTVIQQLKRYDKEGYELIVFESHIADRDTCQLWQGKRIFNEAEQDIFIKVIPQNEESIPLVQNEMQIYNKIGVHNNIIPLYAVVKDSMYLYFCYELGTPIAAGKQSEAQALSLLRDLAQGLDHLHKRSIFHLDIKLDNLVFASGAIKIIDLAGSLDTNKPCGQIFTTSGYETPEILNGCRRYSTKYDMWSVGLILTEMTQGRRLYFQKFKDTDLREQYFKEEKHLEPLQKCTMSKQMYKMIRRCLKYEPKKRPSAERLLTWINKIEFERQVPQVKQIPIYSKEMTMKIVTSVEELDAELSGLPKETRMMYSFSVPNLDDIVGDNAPYLPSVLFEKYYNKYAWSKAKVHDFCVTLWQDIEAFGLTKVCNIVCKVTKQFNTLVILNSLKNLHDKSIERISVVDGGIATFAWIFAYSYSDYKNLGTYCKDIIAYFKPVIDLQVLSRTHIPLEAMPDTIGLLKLGGYQVTGPTDNLPPSFLLGLKYLAYSVYCRNFTHYWTEKKIDFIACPGRMPMRFYHIDSQQEVYDPNILLFQGEALLKHMKEFLSLFSSHTQYKTNKKAFVQYTTKSNLELENLFQFVRTQGYKLFRISELDSSLNFIDRTSVVKRDRSQCR